MVMEKTIEQEKGYVKKDSGYFFDSEIRSSERP